MLKAGAELVVVFGASAIADRRDVIPAVESIGGRIEHFGMPVDPGNLMLIGQVRGQPILGAPGCARSPKENGFDWILARLLAGLPVSREDVTGLGVGGFNHGNRDAAATPRRARAEEVAAGRGDRSHRRPLDPHGRARQASGRDRRPAALRIAAGRALASRARPVIVVTGHQHDQVEAALAGLDVRRVHNPDFAQGLSTSLKAGLAAVPDDVDGAIVCGDMPQVTAPLIDKLVAAFDPERGALVVVPTMDGKRGNPVLWARRFFPDLMAVEGDVGARYLIGRYPEAVSEVPLTGTAALTDVDTPEALIRVRAELEGA